MREEERRLFPLTTIGGVVQLFRLQLMGEEEPNIALLSIVAGCIENSMTSPRTGTVTEVGTCTLWNKPCDSRTGAFSVEPLWILTSQR